MLPLFRVVALISVSRGGVLSLATVIGLYATLIAMALAALMLLGMISLGPSRLGRISTADESAQGRLKAWWLSDNSPFPPLKDDDL